MPTSRADRPRLTAVWPDGPVWPVNILRLHVAFDREIDPGGAAGLVRLETREGAPVQGAFADLPDGLWSPDGRVLTLLMHPGRLKRGLSARRRLGGALARGCAYRVVVDGRFADIDGRAIGRATAVGFEAGAAVETAVDPRQWRWRRPEPGSARPLEIVADRLIDALAIHGALDLTDPKGARFPVDWTAKGFSIWAKPRGPWPCAPLELVAGPNLEDVCGNRPGEPFERATPRAAAASRAGATVHAA